MSEPKVEVHIANINRGEIRFSDLSQRDQDAWCRFFLNRVKEAMADPDFMEKYGDKAVDCAESI